MKNLREQTSSRVSAKISDVLDKNNVHIPDVIYQNNKKLYANLETSTMPNGDINAALLFGGFDGNDTRYLPEEDEAVNAFVENIVGMQHIPVKANSNQLSTATGQRYENLRQRYVAYLGTAETSLWNVANFYKAQPELVKFFEQAQLTPTEIVKKYGVSINEVLTTYVHKIMGSAVLKDNASTNSNEKVLRQLLQNEVMNSWIDFQRLQAIERLQVLEASKLALLQEEVLRDEANILYRDSVGNR